MDFRELCLCSLEIESLVQVVNIFISLFALKDPSRVLLIMMREETQLEAGFASSLFQYESHVHEDLITNLQLATLQKDLADAIFKSLSSMLYYTYLMSTTILFQKKWCRLASQHGRE